MDVDLKKIIIYKFFGPLCFLLSGIGALWWFIHSLYYLLKDLDDSFVLINQGAYYALGASIAFLSVATVIILDQWIMKPISHSYMKIANTLILFSFILTLILPHT